MDTAQTTVAQPQAPEGRLPGVVRAVQVLAFLTNVGWFLITVAVLRNHHLSTPVIVVTTVELVMSAVTCVVTARLPKTPALWPYLVCAQLSVLVPLLVATAREVGSAPAAVWGFLAILAASLLLMASPAAVAFFRSAAAGKPAHRVRAVLAAVYLAGAIAGVVVAYRDATSPVSTQQFYLDSRYELVVPLSWTPAVEPDADSVGVRDAAGDAEVEVTVQPGLQYANLNDAATAFEHHVQLVFADPDVSARQSLTVGGHAAAGWRVVSARDDPQARVEYVDLIETNDRFYLVAGMTRADHDGDDRATLLRILASFAERPAS